MDLESSRYTAITVMEMIQGSCHCGAVQWWFDGMPDGATACNCVPCRRYGALWAYDFEGERIKVSGTTRAHPPDYFGRRARLGAVNHHAPPVVR